MFTYGAYLPLFTLEYQITQDIVYKYIPTKNYLTHTYVMLHLSPIQYKAVAYVFIAITTHNWIPFRKVKLPILSVWSISMIAKKVFCHLIALPVYHWPSVFFKIFQFGCLWCPFLLLIMLIDVANTQKSSIDAITYART